MGLDALQPGNTKRARATAVKAFDTFLKSENVDWEYVKGCISSDTSRKAFVSVMDKIGVYLLFMKKRQVRNVQGTHSCNTTVWLSTDCLISSHSTSRLSSLSYSKWVEHQRALLKERMRWLCEESCCMYKGRIEANDGLLYLNAFSSSDYQDPALLSLLWYMFERASDLAHVHKQYVSIDASDIFFVRFIRVKTCEEQGLSYFADADFDVSRCS